MDAKDLLLKDEDLFDLLLLDIAKVKEVDTEPHSISEDGRKSNSLSDLVKPNPNGKKYKQVQSKVANYIAALPAPGAGQRKKAAFKKYTSMPGAIQYEPETKLELEYREYKKQAIHTIKELQKQVLQDNRNIPAENEQYNICPSRWTCPWQ